MAAYSYDPDTNTYRLEQNTENFALADVSDQTDANVEGNALDNVITGNDAHNSLDGSDGADTLVGGAGNDEYAVNEIGDVVIENAGGGSSDKVSSYVSYTLPDYVEALELHGYEPLKGTGNVQANWILGNDANNVRRGAEGDDTLIGSNGDDTIDGGAGADRLWGGSGNDTYIIDENDAVTEDAGAEATGSSHRSATLWATTSRTLSSEAYRVWPEPGMSSTTSSLAQATTIPWREGPGTIPSPAGEVMMS